MKKLISALVFLFVFCSSVFAGHVLGSEQNLSFNADFAYLLTAGQQARTDDEKSASTEHDSYFTNAIGFSLGALYDNVAYPLDFYLDWTICFPKKHLQTDTAKNTSVTYYKDEEATTFRKSNHNPYTSWTMNKISLGALIDIKIKSTSLLAVKAGCGLGFNSFDLSNTGNTENATRISQKQHFQNIGIEIKGLATYNFAGNFYLNCSLAPTFNFLASYTKMDKTGSKIEGTNNRLQFAFGFNVLANIGISCNL